MFYKQKYEAARAANTTLIHQMQVQHTEIRTLREENGILSEAKEKAAKAALNAANEITRLQEENNTLCEANGELKRALDLEMRQKEELDKLLCQAQRRYTCPEDCAHQANYRGCRTCTRNPHAVDKYEAADHFAACGY